MKYFTNAKFFHILHNDETKKAIWYHEKFQEHYTWTLSNCFRDLATAKPTQEIL